MTQLILQWTQGIPHELAIVLMAVLPVIELRAALPIAIVVFHLHPLSALFYSVIGNLLPAFFLFPLFPLVLRVLKKDIPFVHRLVEHHLTMLQVRHQKNYQSYGAFFLLLFVAIPLPGFGVWTGVPLAILFGMKNRVSIPAVIGGSILSGLIVLAFTVGSIRLF